MNRLIILITLISLYMTPVKAQVDPAIIPQPLQITKQEGSFHLSAGSVIYVDTKLPQLKRLGSTLATAIADRMGLKLKLQDIRTKKSSGGIILKFEPNHDQLGKEGYFLKIGNQQIEIVGTEAGIFYGIQSLNQLLLTSPTGKSLDLPALDIYDQPGFGWRGMMLDVGRHFYPVSYIKKYLDYMAFHKLNTFHWHLVEDAGWRIEIKKYPKLTQIGSKRPGTQYGKAPAQYDATPHEGYYSQEEIKEVVAYAAERFITVIPEIEMPGHSMSALAAYPEYSCTGGPFEVSKHWVRTHDIYCAGNDNTFKFLEDVLTEVAALFPGEYIHIGGDEAPKTRWKVCSKCQNRIKEEGLKDEHELQSYFIKRIERFMQTKNKKIIGWDEILEGGLAPNAAVMSWRGTEGGVAAAKMKHDVVMSPTTFMYFDYPQGVPSLEDMAFGPLLTLQKVYSFEPVHADLTEELKHYIKGVQGNVWSEFIHSVERLEYMSFPRAAALAEVAWTQPERKSWEDFKRRLESQVLRYDAMGINYAKSMYDVQVDVQIDSLNNQATVTLFSDADRPDIYYTLDKKAPGKTSEKYVTPIKVTLPFTLKSIAYYTRGRQSKLSVKEVSISPKNTK